MLADGDGVAAELALCCGLLGGGDETIAEPPPIAPGAGTALSDGVGSESWFVCDVASRVLASSGNAMEEARLDALVPVLAALTNVVSSVAESSVDSPVMLRRFVSGGVGGGTGSGGGRVVLDVDAAGAGIFFPEFLEFGPPGTLLPGSCWALELIAAAEDEAASFVAESCEVHMAAKLVPLRAAALARPKNADAGSCAALLVIADWKLEVT
jgi:hypothetical protein